MKTLLVSITLAIIVVLAFTGTLNKFLNVENNPARDQIKEITCVTGAVRQLDGTCIMENQ